MIKIDNNIKQKVYFLKISGLWGNWTCSLLDYNSEIEKYNFENFYYNGSSHHNITIVNYHHDDNFKNINSQSNQIIIQQMVHPNDSIWYLWCNFEKNDQEKYVIKVDDTIIQEQLISDYFSSDFRHHSWIKNEINSKEYSIEFYKNNSDKFNDFLINMFYKFSLARSDKSIMFNTPITDNCIFLHEYSNRKNLYKKLSKFVDESRFNYRYDILVDTNKKYLNLYKNFLIKLKENQRLNILEKSFCYRILFNTQIHDNYELSKEFFKENWIEKFKNIILEWAYQDYESRYM